MEYSLKDKIINWGHPIVFMSIALQFYLIAAWDSLLHNPKALFNGEAYAKGFAGFWLYVSPPLEGSKRLQPHMQGSFAALPGLLNSASGNVLELGPGSGTLMQYFDTAKIRSLVAVEPNTELHPALQQSASAIGLAQDKFKLLACGAEAESLVQGLAKASLLSGDINDGLFDTIVSVRSLCTIKEPRKAFEAHYALLRPGGKYILFEHVVNSWPNGNGNVIGRLTQYIFTVLGWPYLIGCSLTRDTIEMIKVSAAKDGGWAKVEITKDAEWATLPWAHGTFVKKV